MRRPTIGLFVGWILCCAEMSTSRIFAQELEVLPKPPVVIGQDEPAVAIEAEINASEMLAEENGFETLTRGPLHEAFAEPVASGSVSVLLVPREPPLPIQEQAPEYRPEGDDAVWIPGYWGWDEDRNDFIWISGVYRVPPIGHRWVPGYWNATSDGWQWIQGFWIEETIPSVEYLPEPPPTLEIGPSSPSPGSDYFYIPGYWSNAPTGYQWNVGYWYPLQDDNVWVPCHYVWTPRGSVFVRGYWDRRLPLRGLCFAPVYFPAQTISRVGWYYRPSVVLNSQVLLHNLFVQPGYRHYLFGDYYNVPVARSIVPAYLYHTQRGQFDPLISYYTAYNARRGQDMLGWYHQRHNNLQRNPDLRPPHSWSKVVSSPNSNTMDLTSIAHKLDHLQKSQGELRITPISSELKKETLKNTEIAQRISRERASLEKLPQVNLKTGDINAGISNRIDSNKLDLPKIELKGKSDKLTSKLPELPNKALSDRHLPKFNNSNTGRTNGLNNLQSSDLRDLNRAGADLERRLRDSVRSNNSKSKPDGSQGPSTVPGVIPPSSNLNLPSNATQASPRILNTLPNVGNTRSFNAIQNNAIQNNASPIPNSTNTGTPGTLNPSASQSPRPWNSDNMRRNLNPSQGNLDVQRGSSSPRNSLKNVQPSQPTEMNSNRRLTDPILKNNAVPSSPKPIPEIRSEKNRQPLSGISSIPQVSRLDSIRSANGPTAIPQPKVFQNVEKGGSLKNEIQRGAQRPVVPDVSIKAPQNNQFGPPNVSGKRGAENRSQGGSHSKGPNGRK